MICKDCPNELPPSSKPNLSGRCLRCRRIAAKSSNDPNTKEYQAKYRAANREKRNAAKKAWYESNKTHKLQKDKENKEKDHRPLEIVKISIGKLDTIQILNINLENSLGPL